MLVFLFPTIIILIRRIVEQNHMEKRSIERAQGTAEKFYIA